MPRYRISTKAVPCALLLHFLIIATVLADARAQIEQIERLPRAGRLGAYEKALAQKGLSDADRQALVIAFAPHAKDVSPLYGKGNFPFDVKAWKTTLQRGFEPQSPDQNVAMALAQLLIDSGDRAAAAPVVSAFKRAFPQHHAALAWEEWCQEAAPAGGRAEELLTFPLHFCIVTSNTAARKAATREQCLKEVEILNRTFRTLQGAALVRFEFKGYSSYEIAKDSKNELVEFLDSGQRYDGDRIMKAFNSCDDPRIRDRNAINIYIYDSRSSAAGDNDMTSHGRRNSNRPYVLIDWQRLGGKVQNAQAHEMGHAFGLEHVGVPGATGRASTNIMTSAGESFGSGGLRDLGFTPSQSAIILYHAQRTYQRLGLKRK